MAEPSRPRYAVVFVAWGTRFIADALTCIRRSHWGDLAPDFFLVTDATSPVPEPPAGLQVIRTTFDLPGNLRKTLFPMLIPQDYDAYLFLDTDTLVVGDITLGFEKARRHGIAMAMAPFYSLECYSRVFRFRRDGMVNRDRINYNSGVIFFSFQPGVREVFQRSVELARQHQQECRSDQVMLSWAMDDTGFNPYALSPSYNIRGFGEFICGDVRIWHSYDRLPRNVNRHANAWPPRCIVDGCLVHSKFWTGLAGWMFFWRLWARLTRPRLVAAGACRLYRLLRRSWK